MSVYMYDKAWKAIANNGIDALCDPRGDNVSGHW